MQPESESPSILVVDDNEVNRGLMSTLLARMGYHCTLAQSGEQALDLLHGNAFDLILMDCMMPDMNGIETTVRFKDPSGSYSNRTVPVVALSAQTTRENRENCRRAGMVDFLEKPINREALISVLNQWIRK